MDGNKDESERCLRLVEELLSKGSFQKAYRFAQKANQLYPTDRTQGLLLFDDDHHYHHHFFILSLFIIFLNL